jgi:hypothetical protein
MPHATVTAFLDAALPQDGENNPSHEQSCHEVHKR